ncbi:MAG: hypothetical protein ABS54_10080 [Hyphomicrobium sp. SCN 65-11]|nr:MAG: hypothetical protein ABS54_10080 [Hyphomicrobium sp. SCN 65-11]
MAKTPAALLRSATTGKVVIPKGATFADLFDAWRIARDDIGRLEARHPWPRLGNHPLVQAAIDVSHALEQAMYEAPIETPDELAMLAHVELTFDECEHHYPGVFTKAVLHVLARMNVQAAKEIETKVVTELTELRANITEPMAELDRLAAAAAGRDGP